MKSESFGAYKHVLFFGVDGMGNFNTKTDTPNMTKLFKDGATEPQKDSPEHLSNFIDTDKLLFWMNFEEGVCDVTEKCEITPKKRRCKCL